MKQAINIKRTHLKIVTNNALQVGGKTNTNYYLPWGIMIETESFQ